MTPTEKFAEDYERALLFTAEECMVSEKRFAIELEQHLVRLTARWLKSGVPIELVWSRKP